MFAEFLHIFYRIGSESNWISNSFKSFFPKVFHRLTHITQLWTKKTFQTLCESFQTICEESFPKTTEFSNWKRKWAIKFTLEFRFYTFSNSYIIQIKVSAGKLSDWVIFMGKLTETLSLWLVLRNILILNYIWLKLV